MKAKHLTKITQRRDIYPQPASSAEAIFFYLYFSVINLILSAAFAEKAG
ncbi:MAG TPA: hypothetical protein PLX23_13465 [Candidatus Hydrogenedens sp.]|nr:hypothetical protein [Candidatus Hydrogenedens sp.]